MLSPRNRIPSTVERVIWKKIVCVCVCFCDQRSKVNLKNRGYRIEGFWPPGIESERSQKKGQRSQVNVKKQEGINWRILAARDWKWKVSFKRRVKGQLKKTVGYRIQTDFFTVGPPHNGVDLGVTWSDLSFAPIKTEFFSRNSRENPCSKPIGGSRISRLVVVIIRKVSSISIVYF